MFGNLLRNAAGALVGRTGRGIQQLGNTFRLPQTVPGGIGAQLQIAGRKLNPVKPVMASDGGDVLGASTGGVYSNQYQSRPNAPQSVRGTYNPSTGGAGMGGGGGAGGVGDVGPTDTGGGTFDPFSGLRQAYDYAKGIYEQQFPGLEADYTRIKGDVEGAIGRAKETLGEQVNDIGVGFGENLRNLLTRGRELGQKTRNVYSGLNALDSSSYGDEQIKQEQGLFDAQTKLEATKTRDEKEANRGYADYEAKATGYIADLGKQYMAGKQSLQQAIADNNVEEASAILGWMDKIGSTITNAKLGLAQLQAEGVDVVGNSKKFNRGGLDSIFGNYLSSIYNPSLGGLATVGAPAASGSGYISPRTGRQYRDYNEFLANEG